MVNLPKIVEVQICDVDTGKYLRPDDIEIDYVYKSLDNEKFQIGSDEKKFRNRGDFVNKFYDELFSVSREEKAKLIVALNRCRDVENRLETISKEKAGGAKFCNDLAERILGEISSFAVQDVISANSTLTVPSKTYTLQKSTSSVADFTSMMTSLEWAVKDLLSTPANKQVKKMYSEVMDILVDEDFQNTYLRNLYFRDLKLHALKTANLTENQRVEEYADFLLERVNEEIITTCLNKGIDLKAILGNVIMGKTVESQKILTRPQRMQMKRQMLVLQDKLGDKIESDIEAFMDEEKLMIKLSENADTVRSKKIVPGWKYSRFSFFFSK